MEEMTTMPQKIYEDITKKERNLLRKEFNKGVETQFKIFLWIGFVLLLPAIIGGGFSIYYLLNILLTCEVAFQLYVCAVIFTVGCVGSLLLTSQYHKKFRRWLREYKDIITKTDIMNKHKPHRQHKPLPLEILLHGPRNSILLFAELD